MMNYSHSLAAILGVSMALVQVQPAQAFPRLELSKVARSITVMIQDPQSPQTAGSGIIIKREGETYTVLTAHHVVQQSPNYQVMTLDGKMNPIVRGSIQPLPGVDLALVQFKSAGSYGVAKMGDSTQNPSGSASFVAGFPSTTAMRVGPVFYFTSGEIAANGSRPNKDGYALAYSNPTRQGMSGGPVLNEQGELIGIHGRVESAENLQNSQLRDDIAVLKTKFNYAIPINTFLTLAPQVNKTLALRIPSPSAPSAPKADDFFLQADTKLNNLDYKGALVDYDQAIRINPNFSNAYLGRAVARSRLGDKKGAIADFDQAIRLDPKDTPDYANRGLIRYKLGNKKGAIADLDQVIRLNPKYAPAYANRGNVRYKLGDRQGAIADYDQAIRLDPKYDVAYYNRAFIRYKLGDRQGAIADLDQAIRLDPKYAPAYVNRGNVRNELGDRQGAIADWQKAAALLKNQGKGYQAVLRNLQEINGR